MLRVVLDVDGIVDTAQRLPDVAREVMTKAAAALAAQTHAHIVEQVQTNLHSSRKQYIDALHYKQVSDDTWLISLDKKAFWIEEGISSNKEMIDDLLNPQPGSKGKVKIAKDGSKYRVIPFNHSGPPSDKPQAGQDLQQTIQSELRKRKIPYTKIENDANGAPKLGLLHRLDIMDKPKNTSDMWKKLHGSGAPGMGWGMPGKVRVGATGIPFLRGIRIYQKQVSDDKGNSKVQRQIMTFRIVSSKMKGTGRWVHPGYHARKFFEEAQEWAVNEWNSHIMPELANEIGQMV